MWIVPASELSIPNLGKIACLIEFILEDTRAFMLTAFTVFCIIAATLYRMLLVPRSLPMQHVIVLNGLEFREVGPESPEQYEVYFQDQMVGYVRYRFGELTANYRDVGMQVIFSRTLEHETGQMTDLERGRWLPVIARRLRRRLPRSLRSTYNAINDLDVLGLRFEPVPGPGNERYFVYDGAQIIGFVEFRRGVIRADYPDEGFEVLFEEIVSDDDRRLTKQEREKWFPVIAKQLRARAKLDS